MALFEASKWYDFKPVRNPATYNPDSRFEAMFNSLVEKGGMDLVSAIEWMKEKLDAKTNEAIAHEIAQQPVSVTA